MPRIERYIRWIGIPILALAMMYIQPHQRELPVWLEYVYSLFFTGIYWNGAYLIFMFYRKTIPEMSHTVRRLFATVFTLLIFIVVAGTLGKMLIGHLKPGQIMDTSIVFEFFPITFIACVVIGSFYEGAYYFANWKETVRLNEELKNQQFRTQLEVLQNQMSPHFLFNSLNALTTLISENQDVAIEFTQKLSEVYRYILQNRERELVLLSEEMEFTQSYVYLLQMRYPKNLRVHYEISDDAYDKFIAPLTLQMLVENAVKHNVISNAKPLDVWIRSSDEHSISVQNILQPRSIVQKGTKTGLANIQKRYSFFSDKQINISKSDTDFIVEVPLINLIREKDFVAVTADEHTHN